MSSAQVRRNGPYAPLGANYADDDAIATLDLDEDDRTELLYLRGLAYCARDPRTEGYISDIALATGKVLARRMTRNRTSGGRAVVNSVERSAHRLAELGLWTREGDGYRITAWLKWNKSWDEITLKRGRDAARKSADSDTTDDGTDADSARNPNGVAAPRHGTSRHGSTHHGSSTPPAGAERTDSGSGRGTGATLLEEHQHDLGPLPTTTRDQLERILTEQLLDGATPTQCLAALEEWRRRLDAKPGLLKNLIGDQRRRDTDSTPDPEIEAMLQAAEAKRAKAGAAR